MIITETDEQLFFEVTGMVADELIMYKQLKIIFPYQLVAPSNSGDMCRFLSSNHGPDGFVWVDTNEENGFRLTKNANWTWTHFYQKEFIVWFKTLELITLTKLTI